MWWVGAAFGGAETQTRFELEQGASTWHFDFRWKDPGEGRAGVAVPSAASRPAASRTSYARCRHRDESGSGHAAETPRRSVRNEAARWWSPALRAPFKPHDTTPGDTRPAGRARTASSSRGASTASGTRVTKPTAAAQASGSSRPSRVLATASWSTSRPQAVHARSCNAVARSATGWSGYRATTSSARASRPE
jgi:hypothetical protein